MPRVTKEAMGICRLLDEAEREQIKRMINVKERELTYLRSRLGA